MTNLSCKLKCDIVHNVKVYLFIGPGTNTYEQKLGKIEAVKVFTVKMECLLGSCNVRRFCVYLVVLCRSFWFHEKTFKIVKIDIDMTARLCSAQCGNCRNSLSHSFDKTFVKSTVLLKKLLKSWFDEIFFQWERISHFSTLCVEITEFYMKAVAQISSN